MSELKQKYLVTLQHLEDEERAKADEEQRLADEERLKAQEIENRQREGKEGLAYTQR